MIEAEYSAIEIRGILQELFPHRKLVLSQLTFFNQLGVCRATGETTRRKRQCYRLHDVLPVACVLALKEQGIPLKNISSLPLLLQDQALRIFNDSKNCRISGYGTNVSLAVPGEDSGLSALDAFLSAKGFSEGLFWSMDIAPIVQQLVAVACKRSEERIAA